MPNSNPRQQSITYALARRARYLVLVLLLGSTCGCLNEMIAIAYLIGGPPSIEPDFDKMTGESFTDFEVNVAVVCYAPEDAKWNYPDIHQKIARFVTFRLAQHKVKVLAPDRVQAWLDENDDWDKPEEIGAALDATYVVYIDLQSFNLYENHSSHLFRGQTEAVVSVTKMDEHGDGDKIYSKELTSRYPLMEARPTSEVSQETFEKQYLARLSDELGRLFYETYNGDDFADAL